MEAVMPGCPGMAQIVWSDVGDEGGLNGIAAFWLPFPRPACQTGLTAGYAPGALDLTSGKSSLAGISVVDHARCIRPANSGRNTGPSRCPKVSRERITQGGKSTRRSLPCFCQTTARLPRRSTSRHSSSKASERRAPVPTRKMINGRR